MKYRLFDIENWPGVNIHFYRFYWHVKFKWYADKHDFIASLYGKAVCLDNYLPVRLAIVRIIS